MGSRVWVSLYLGGSSSLLGMSSDHGNGDTPMGAGERIIAFPPLGGPPVLNSMTAEPPRDRAQHLPSLEAPHGISAPLYDMPGDDPDNRRLFDNVVTQMSYFASPPFHPLQHPFWTLLTETLAESQRVQGELHQLLEQMDHRAIPPMIGSYFPSPAYNAPDPFWQYFYTPMHPPLHQSESSSPSANESGEQQYSDAEWARWRAEQAQQSEPKADLDPPIHSSPSPPVTEPPRVSAGRSAVSVSNLAADLTSRLEQGANVGRPPPFATGPSSAKDAYPSLHTHPLWENDQMETFITSDEIQDIDPNYKPQVFMQFPLPEWDCPVTMRAQDSKAFYGLHLDFSYLLSKVPAFDKLSFPHRTIEAFAYVKLCLLPFFNINLSRLHTIDGSHQGRTYHLINIAKIQFQHNPWLFPEFLSIILQKGFPLNKCLVQRLKLHHTPFGDDRRPLFPNPMQPPAEDGMWVASLSSWADHYLGTGRDPGHHTSSPWFHHFELSLSDTPLNIDQWLAILRYVIAAFRSFSRYPCRVNLINTKIGLQELESRSLKARRDIAGSRQGVWRPHICPPSCAEERCPGLVHYAVHRPRQ